MPSRSRRHAPAVPRGGRDGSRRSPADPPRGRCRVAPLPPLRRPRHEGALPRCSSAPTLPTVRFVPGGTHGENEDDDGEISQILPRHCTCTDVYSPALALSPFAAKSTEGYSNGGSRSGEGKVVVSVTVEGSPGPVRAMVRLGATVEEAIGAVVDAYGREGRSPRLDPSAVASFQLHHNHFSLQSLNKADKLGQLGGRSFYLRRDAAGGRDGDAAGGGGLVVASDTSRPQPLVLLSTHRFLSVITGRLSKIGRKVTKLWTALGCSLCA